MRSRSIGCIVAAIVAAAAPAVTARANPKALPFTYPYTTLPKGAWEVEQYVDLDPVKALSTSTGEPVWFVATQLQTEIEVGITDRLELGLYATIVPQPTDAFAAAPTMFMGNGAKQRLRYRFAEEGQLPLDFALYFEVVENEREIEFELKTILARKLGKLHLHMNLSAELEFYFAGQTEVVLNPTAGITYQVAPEFNPGIEYWLHAEFPFAAGFLSGFNLEPQNYIGPAMNFNFGPAWWTVGGYFRLNSIGYALQPGDAFGPLWFRSIVGIGI